MEMVTKRRGTFLLELTIDCEEARVLKAMMQNALCEDESEDVRLIRSKIFNSLHDGGA